MKTVIGITALAIFLLAGSSIGYRWYSGSNQPLSAQAETVSRTTAIPRGPIAPEIVSATWLNSAPLASADLRGKVVVVEFWAFG